MHTCIQELWLQSDFVFPLILMFVTSLLHVLFNMKNVSARLMNYCRCSCTLDVLYFWSVWYRYRFSVCPVYTCATAHILVCSIILIKLSSILFLSDSCWRSGSTVWLQWQRWTLDTSSWPAAWLRVTKYCQAGQLILQLSLVRILFG